MGIGAAAIMPSTLSVLTNVFTDASERAKAIAMWSAVAGLGVAIGPTLGGWLLEHFGWGSIFTVNLPIVAVALAGGRLVVPPSANPHPKALDPTGALVSIAGLVAVVYAIIEAPSNGWAIHNFRSYLRAHALGIQAIRSPSAAGVDDFLAAFVQRIGIGTIEPSLAQEWHSISDLGSS